MSRTLQNERASPFFAHPTSPYSTSPNSYTDYPNSSSRPFKIDQPSSITLKTVLSGAMSGKGKAPSTSSLSQGRLSRVINVAVRSESASMLVHFSPDDGVADLRIENRCEHLDINFREGDLGDPQILRAGFQLLFTRDDASCDNISWAIEGATTMARVEHKLSYFGFRKLTYIWGGENFGLYALSFPDGPQRVLVITENLSTAETICAACGLTRDADDARPEVPTLDYLDTHFSLALAGVGISLVLGTPAEVAYLSISGRDTWEWLLPEPDQWGEDWRRFGVGAEKKLSRALVTTPAPETVTVDEDAVVKLREMSLAVKSKAPVPVRFHAHPGLLFTYSDSKDHTMIRLNIEHLQLDNQMIDPFIPVILAPSKLESQRAPVLPFIKILYIQAKPEPDSTQHAVQMIERVSLLIQKMDVSVTERFLLAVSDFATFGEAAPEVTHVEVWRDIQMASDPLFTQDFINNTIEKKTSLKVRK